MLFFSSIAHKTKLQDALQSNAKFFNEIKGEKLGKLLINLSQISTENDYDSLYDALDALLSDFEQKFKTQQELYEEAERLYKSAITNYESKIESLEITLADLQQDLNNNLEPEYTQIQEELETLQERIEKIQQQIIDFTNIRNKEKTENDKRNKDLTDALEAIDETLELLQSLASENSENVESVSLIQNKKQSLFQVKNRLQKKLGNIRNSFEYKPIIEALTQITLNDDYVDQTILRKVTDLLQEIRNEFNEMSYSIQQQEEQAQINFESTIANYNDDLELSQRLYKENTSKLGDLKGKNLNI